MGVRTWALRRAMGRFRIDDEIVRHLSTFQRLGEGLEIQLPGELLPVGARTIFRAVRTRAASQLGTDWVWPYWLERQVDPASPTFIPRGHLPFLANVTRRNWTAVGNVGSPWEAVVDERGLVTPWFDGWSLDWWVGADDRWHLPSREVAVRQRLVGGSPVVETSMAVPGGDAVHRAYAIHTGEDEHIVVEIENRSRLPFVVGLAARPYNPEGLAVVERIQLHDRVVTVDGRPAMLLPKAPAAIAASNFHDGDSLHVVTSGRAGTSMPNNLRCEAGLAQAAFLFPLAHTATLRVAIPLVPARRTRRRGLTRRRVERVPAMPASLPTGEQVAKGWEAQTRRGMQLELPDPRLAEAVDANRRFLLVLHDGEDITPGPATYHRFWFRDAAYMLAALDRYGFHDEAREVLASYPERQHVDGFFFSQRQEWDSNGAALYALAEHWRLTGDDSLVRAMEPSVLKALHWIERKRRAKRRRRDPALANLMPASISAEHLGPFDYFYWDSFWSLRGLHDGAELLRVAGDPDGASTAERWAGELRGALDASIRLVRQRLGTDVLPAGPRRRIDHGIIGGLAACWPLGLYAPDEPWVAATAEEIRRRFSIGDAFFQGISHTGLGTYLTLQLAFVELEANDPRCLDRLQWMVAAATPTWTWPEAIHPQHGGGCMGDGHHGWAAADFLSFVRALLVREVPARGAGGRRDARGNGGLALCSMLLPGWEGQPIEVHDAPTPYGRLSYAVRWHGERPALLWEIDPLPGRSVPRLTAPGLDPTWSTDVLRGEALLAPFRAEPPSSFT